MDGGNGKRRRKTASSTREQILRVSTDLFGRYGYDRVSIRQIAAESGANLGAVTYHFGGKEELYAQTIEALTADIERFLGPLLDRLNERTAEAGGDRDALREIAGGFIRDWARQTLDNAEVQARMPILARELISPTGAFDRIFTGFYLRLNEGLETLVSAAADAPVDGVDLKVRVHALSSLMLGFISNEKVFWRFLGWDGYSPERIETLLPALSEAFVAAAGLADRAPSAGA